MQALGIGQEDVPMLLELLETLEKENEQAHIIQLLSHMKVGLLVVWN